MGGWEGRIGVSRKVLEPAIQPEARKLNLDVRDLQPKADLLYYQQFKSVFS